MNSTKSMGMPAWPHAYWPTLAGKPGYRATQVVGLLTAVCMAVAVWMALRVPPDTSQGDLVRILYFHVPAAWLAFLAFSVVALASLLYLWKRDRRWDVVALASAEFGVIMTALTIIAGSM